MQIVVKRDKRFKNYTLLMWFLVRLSIGKLIHMQLLSASKPTFLPSYANVHEINLNATHSNSFTRFTNCNQRISVE